MQPPPDQFVATQALITTTRAFRFSNHEKDSDPNHQMPGGPFITNSRWTLRLGFWTTIRHARIVRETNGRRTNCRQDPALGDRKSLNDETLIDRTSRTGPPDGRKAERWRAGPTSAATKVGRGAMGMSGEQAAGRPLPNSNRNRALCPFVRRAGESHFQS